MLTFNAPLKTSLVPTRALGGSTPTFTRATTAYVQDHEGILRLCKSGEARFHGARRVRNYLQSSFVQASGVAGWSVYAGSTYSVTTGIDDPRGGTDARRVTLLTGAPTSGFLAVVSGSPVYANGESGVSSAWFRAPSGALNIQLYSQGTDNVRTELTIDDTWRRYASTPADESGKSLYWIVGFVDGAGGILDVFEPQLEKVSGQSNQAPAEYVSSGVLSAPYHGAGVDGVRYFDTENGNSVVSNVVTEATGAAIADDTLKGYLSEGQRTNRCLYSEDFTNAAWVKTNCTISADSIAAPNGATTADTLTATAGNATMIQDLGVVASASKAGGVWLKRKTGSGNIQLTMDNGTGWTTVAVTGTWTRFSKIQTLADEDFGIRIVTSGDEIYVWGGQVETGIATAYIGTYIPTTAAAVTKNPDYLTFPVASNLNDALATIAADTCWFVRDQGNNIVGGPGCGCYVQGGNVSGLYDAVTDTVGTHPESTGTLVKVAFSFSGVVCHVYMNGLSDTGVFDGTLVNAATMYIGVNVLWPDTNTLRNVRIWDEVLPIGPTGFPIQPVLGGMMSSLYASRFKNADSITPHDTNRADYDALSVGADGNVQVDTEDGSTVVIYMAAGVIYPIKVIRVYSTNTAATSIVGYR